MVWTVEEEGGKSSVRCASDERHSMMKSAGNVMMELMGLAPYRGPS